MLPACKPVTACKPPAGWLASLQTRRRAPAAQCVRRSVPDAAAAVRSVRQLVTAQAPACSIQHSNPLLALALPQWVVYTPDGSFPCICDGEAYAANIRYALPWHSGWGAVRSGMMLGPAAS
jgi:hypothetical protein